MKLAAEIGRDSVSGRFALVDRARGVAVVAMVVDHVCAFALALWVLPPWLSSLLIVLRYTVGRVALPLFMICTGVLLTGRKRGGARLRQIALLGAAVSWSVSVTGAPIALPDILLLWSLVMLGHRVLYRNDLAPWIIAVGMVQSYAWKIPAWQTYQPGTVAALICVGVLGGRRMLDWCELAPRWLDSIGKRALLWYGAHMFVLVGVWAVLS